MSQLIGHVVRRGLDVANHDGANGAGDHGFKLPRDLLGVSFMLVAVIYWFGIMSIQYTYGQVIATLAMVETPQTTTTITVAPKNLEEKEESEDIETVVKVPAITSHFFRSVGVLHERAGRFAPYRGLMLYIIYNTAAGGISILLLQAGLGALLSSVITLVAFAGLGMAWTHVVISMPSTKWWGKRMPSYTSWKKIVPVTALYAVANYLTTAYPTAYFGTLGLDRYLHHPDLFKALDNQGRSLVILQYFFFVLIAFALSVLVLLPTAVMLTRVQASMLPEEDEPIFPFDRTFGGRVVSEEDGGNGTLSLRDAWRSFDWASRVRLLKLYCKLAAIEGAVSLAFLGTLAIYMFLL